MQKRIITYQEFGNLLDQLVNKLKDLKFDYIYGIPRGGLPIAVHLSHHLDVELIDYWTLKWNNQLNKRILLVDDIVDTGKTINILRNELSLESNMIITVAALFKRPKIDNIKMYVESTPDWIVFPFETYEEEPSEYHQEVYSELFTKDSK